LLGATVIKIERPRIGDWVRDPTGREADGMGAGFLAQNANKRSIVIDLKHARGPEVVAALVRGADVFLENFSPGTAARLGLGEERLMAEQPKLVYASISGYGQDGPMASRPAYDHVVQAVSGVMSVTGTPETAPTRIGPPMIDYIAGIYGAFAVLAALRQRDRTGQGQRVDVAMLDCALAAMASFVSGWLNAGQRPQPAGNTAASGSAASGVFETASGKLGLAANQERQLAALARAIGREDLLCDPRFASDTARRENRNALREILDAAFATASAAEWEERLSAVHVPAGVVREIPEILASEQVRARGVVHALRDRESGATLYAQGAGFKLNGIVPAPTEAPPRLGEHTDELLREAGYGRAQIAELRRTAVVA
jgi:crotonobetainyl-CoA:carnitine CoA-transferase CaiB-like acyl-CoA transferase